MNLKRTIGLVVLMLTAGSTFVVESNSRRRHCLRVGCNKNQHSDLKRPKHQVKHHKKHYSRANLAKGCLIGRIFGKKSNSKHIKKHSRRHCKHHRCNNFLRGCLKSRYQNITRSHGNKSRNCSNGRCARRSNFHKAIQKKYGNQKKANGQKNNKEHKTSGQNGKH